MKSCIIWMHCNCIVWIHLIHVFMCYMNSCINQFHVFMSSLYLSYAGTNNQKNELFVMAVRSLTGKTFSWNFVIIPSAKKWVFYATYHLAYLSLYGKHMFVELISYYGWRGCRVLFLWDIDPDTWNVLIINCYAMPVSCNMATF